MEPQKVYLVGAGPGNLGLITVRGLEILKQADVVIHDYLIDRQLLGQARVDAELICTKELGKFRYEKSQDEAQASICDSMVKKAKEGKRVIRLKNGDPTVFARLEEELYALTENNIEYEIVPGISAGTAAAAYMGIPLTEKHVSSNVVFVTGHEPQGHQGINWKHLAQCGTIVLYMAVKSISQVVEQLIAAGKPSDTPAAVISHIGSVDMKTASGTLETIQSAALKQSISPPAVFIIGDSALFETQYNWFKKNKKIVFTGLSDERYFLSGSYFHIPMIQILPLQDYTELDNHICDIRRYNWLVFASRYGVQYFFERLFALGYDARHLNDARIAAVGASTAGKLREFGICADLVPNRESSAGLLEAFQHVDLQGKTLFMPRSDLSDKGLEGGFIQHGARVTSCVAYRNVPAENLPPLDLSHFDEIILTSPSSVRSVVNTYKQIPKTVAVRCIGDVTRKEARIWGLVD
ncbi:uroporphyrinogen-III C-methyltransferase [bacterium]|nr:uroporphyrinogen-III C-methyltransferase [bacterium]